jgi:catechol 2,3-dioxygenase-like lactoylglutathione lyase family enzyme
MSVSAVQKDVRHADQRALAMTNFVQITPFMHVPDLDQALAFFHDVLGFEIRIRMDDYAFVHRETVGIRLLQNRGDEGAPPGNRRFACYIDVRDVDALYAELKPALDTLPKADVHGPANKSYGQRELLVLAPDGNVLAFGQAIRDAEGTG